MGTAVKWLKDRCPICHMFFKYPESNYKPSTCGKFDCIHTYLHPKLNRRRI